MQSIFITIYLPNYLFIYPSIHLSIYPSIHLSIYLCICLPINLYQSYMYICLSIYLPIYPKHLYHRFYLCSPIIWGLVWFILFLFHIQNNRNHFHIFHYKLWINNFVPVNMNWHISHFNEQKKSHIYPLHLSIILLPLLHFLYPSFFKSILSISFSLPPTKSLINHNMSSSFKV